MYCPQLPALCQLTSISTTTGNALLFGDVNSNASLPVLKVWVDGHGRRPGTYIFKAGRRPAASNWANGQLILRKISKTGATRRQILRLKCTKFDFRWGSAPDPTGGAYSAPPDPLAVFKVPTFKGREVEGEVKRKGRERGRGG